MIELTPEIRDLTHWVWLNGFKLGLVVGFLAAVVLVGADAIWKRGREE